jgi:transcriptional regulator with XRE-family HTH domain
VIRIARRKSNLSQAQAARKAGISEVYWQQLETGKHRDTPRMDTLVDMLEATNTPVQVLWNTGHEDVAQALEERHNWFGADAMREWR